MAVVAVALPLLLEVGAEPVFAAGNQIGPCNAVQGRDSGPALFGLGQRRPGAVVHVPHAAQSRDGRRPHGNGSHPHAAHGRGFQGVLRLSTCSGWEITAITGPWRVFTLADVSDPSDCIAVACSFASCMAFLQVLTDWHAISAEKIVTSCSPKAGRERPGWNWTRFIAMIRPVHGNLPPRCSLAAVAPAGWKRLQAFP
ncbi:hypothetical protein ACFQGW_21185 [Xanthomonas theicola]|uniref:hypothetical protein n=1 Tax=Xanthomonas theicola TaxID=56464 RepID=UPI00163B1BE8|nr:hypothetical protein [Xanthomonas theicola]QNH25135.1 hypothetical protein G4Q83_10830 [Xanthomonas theicola]